jgi:hypothetical protein
MAREKDSVLFSEIIEIIRDKLADDSIREEIYYDLIGVFHTRGADLEDLLFEDDAFDKAYSEFFEDGGPLWDDHD